MIQTRHSSKWLWVLLLVAVVLYAALAASPVMARGPGGGDCGGGCGGSGGGGGGSATPLSDYEKQALNRAIDEEYYAKAVYEKVMNTFGPISPFNWIARDEQMHVNWVAKLLVKYGLPVPIDRWSGTIALEFTSKQQACLVGAEAESYNAGVYDEMIPQISHDDILSTFTKLGDVSRYRHLPAFQEWADIYESLGE